jgi:hypothetical protein
MTSDALERLRRLAASLTKTSQTSLFQTSPKNGVPGVPGSETAKYLENSGVLESDLEPQAKTPGFLGFQNGPQEPQEPAPNAAVASGVPAKDTNYQYVDNAGTPEPQEPQKTVGVEKEGTTLAGDFTWASPSAHTVLVAEPDGTATVSIRQPGGKWGPMLVVRPSRFETQRRVDRFALPVCTGWCEGCGQSSTWRPDPPSSPNAFVQRWRCVRRKGLALAEPTPSPPEVSKSDCGGVSSASNVSLKEEIHSSGLGGRYVDEGPAPPGSVCTICGRGTDNVRRIRYSQRVNPWHRDCADRHLAGQAKGAVQTPEVPSP